MLKDQLYCTGITGFFFSLSFSLSVIAIGLKMDMKLITRMKWVDLFHSYQARILPLYLCTLCLCVCCCVNLFPCILDQYFPSFLFPLSYLYFLSYLFACVRARLPSFLSLLRTNLPTFLPTGSSCFGAYMVWRLLSPKFLSEESAGEQSKAHICNPVLWRCLFDFVS